MKRFTFLLAAVLPLFAVLCSASEFSVGTAVYDVTGPAADVALYGYAAEGQKAAGIHLRIRARAYIVVDNTSGKRVAFVSCDIGMGSDLVNIMVLEELQKAGLGKYYTNDNLSISGTHTHSSPGGVLQHVLYQIPTVGIVHETLDALVDGIVKVIQKAHKNVAPGEVFLKNGRVEGANINRSPTAYLLNPAEERAKYSDGNTDKRMIMLKLQSEGGEALGMVNWYAVHGTSMNNTNLLISGDNRGYASYLFEQEFNGLPTKVPTGKGKFVAAFASTNLGDVSPNTAGPKCLDTGKPCDDVTSTCNGRNEMCVASGPGKDMFESTEIIAEKQVKAALELYHESGEAAMGGGVDFRASFVEMPGLNVTVGGEKVALCKAALGYSFAAGTTDGPGQFDFTQGDTSGNVFWNTVSHVLSKPTEEEAACHAPKAILLNTGDCTWPYPWHPTTLHFQLFRVGQLVIASVPGELTTMAGRRVREAIKNKLVSGGVLDEKEGTIVIAGLANGYASYITTYEEYQQQRYEGGSTLYGPHTLEGYIQELTRLAGDMAKGSASTTAAPPKSYLSKAYEFVTPVVVDEVPVGAHFGDVTKDVAVVPAPQPAVSGKAAALVRESLAVQWEGEVGPAVVELAAAAAAAPASEAVAAAGPVVAAPGEAGEARIAIAAGTETENAAPELNESVNEEEGGVELGSTPKPAQPVVAKRGEWVEVTFRSASPRNNRRQEGTFLSVEIQEGGSWVQVASDGDWETRFHWFRGAAATVNPLSYATISWHIPPTAAPGSYRLRHFGKSKSLLHHSGEFEGTSSTFTVEA